MSSHRQDATDQIPMRTFSESLPMALLRARETTMGVFRPLLAEHDLTEQQWRVLRALAAADSAVDVGELVDRTSLLAPSLSRILAKLADRMLIARWVAPDDQRRSLIELSPAGAALVKAVAPSSEAIYNRIESEFGTRRLKRLLSELHALAALELGLVENTRSTTAQGQLGRAS